MGLLGAPSRVRLAPIGPAGMLADHLNTVAPLAPAPGLDHPLGEQPPRIGCCIVRRALQLGDWQFAERATGPGDLLADLVQPGNDGWILDGTLDLIHRSSLFCESIHPGGAARER